MKKITIYTSNSCPHCVTAKQFFKEKGIEFAEKNVHTDAEARKELISKGYMGVPVIVIDQEEIQGFDKAKIEELL